MQFDSILGRADCPTAAPLGSLRALGSSGRLASTLPPATPQVMSPPKQNNHPILALLPAAVLRQLRKLSGEHLAEKQLQDIADKYVWQLVLAILALVIFNSANATVFWGICSDQFASVVSEFKGILLGYALAVWLGGIYAMFNAIVAWPEVLAFRRANPIASIPSQAFRFYGASTWLPLILFPLIPALFNVWFSTPFFFGTVLIVFASVVLFPLLANA